jgi:hypothetical protein
MSIACDFCLHSCGVLCFCHFFYLSFNRHRMMLRLLTQMVYQNSSEAWTRNHFYCWSVFVI